jgi:hypothetical protein
MKWQAPSEEELARRGIKPAADEPAAEEAQEAPKPKRKRKKD